MADLAHVPTAAILTLGCKLNLADSEAMAWRLRDAGWNVLDRPAVADAVVVNTCSVTHVADRKSRHLVRLARRIAPDATVALTGCLPKTAAAETIETLGADLVRPQPQQRALSSRRRHLGAEVAVLWERSRPVEGGRVWEGLTDTYMRVYLASETDLRNRVTSARLVALHAEGLWPEGDPATLGPGNLEPEERVR